MTFYDTLFVRGSCPPDCNACLEVCPQMREDGRGAIFFLPDGLGRKRMSICNHCAIPTCVSACPSNAIEKGRDGVVRINYDSCTGCGLCEEGCGRNAIFFDDLKGIPLKCDYCGGAFKCASVCPHGVLSVERAKEPIRYLGEDHLSPGLPFCSGCPVELGVRVAIRTLGRKIVLFGAPSCTVLARMAKIPYYGTLMTNIASQMAGFSLYSRRTGSDTTCVCFVGDGATSDVGFQPLSGAAERGDRILYICYDNEGYMNTGVQRSGTTPPGAWTTTTQVGPFSRGKIGTGKYMPLLIALHGGVSYAATASVSHVEDYVKKLVKARAALAKGMAYLHLFTPCPTGWRTSTDAGISLARLAVETCYFPLWEWENGLLRFTAPVDKPKPLDGFLKLQGRFSHLTTEESLILETVVKERVTLLRKLSFQLEPAGS